MSGGYFNYVQCGMSETADQLATLIRDAETQSPRSPRKHGDPPWSFRHDTLDKMRKCLETLRLATQMIQRVDWLVCGDDGEDTFHARWKQENCDGGVRCS